MRLQGDADNLRLSASATGLRLPESPAPTHTGAYVRWWGMAFPGPSSTRPHIGMCPDRGMSGRGGLLRQGCERIPDGTAQLLGTGVWRPLARGVQG
jgi:hypothetical protein